MTDLLPAPWPAIIFGTAIVAAAVALLVQRLRPPPRPPSGWTHIGTPPAQADAVLGALRMLWPGILGGTIEWVEHPWPDPIEPRWTVVSAVTDYQRHGLKISRGPGALRRLIHEVDHLRRGSPEEGTDGWVVMAETFVSVGVNLED